MMTTSPDEPLTPDEENPQEPDPGSQETPPVTDPDDGRDIAAPNPVEDA